MNISIYIDEKILGKVDQVAKKARLSRSGLIQSVLEKQFSAQKQKSVFDDVFGILEEPDADALLKKIRTSRRNSRRFK